MINSKILIVLIIFVFSIGLFGAADTIDNPSNIISIVLPDQPAPAASNVAFRIRFWDCIENDPLLNGGDGPYNLYKKSAVTGWYEWESGSGSVGGSEYYLKDANTGIIYINVGNYNFDYAQYYGITEKEVYYSIPFLQVQYLTDISGRADWSEVPGDQSLSIGINTTPESYNYENGWQTDDPLPVTLSSFTAVLTDGIPMLQWITQSEVNNAGWNVFRSETDNMDEGLQVNSSLIQGAGTSAQVTEYEFMDEWELLEGVTYNYWLESVSNSGNTKTHGPVSLYIPTEEEEETPEVPIVYGLHQNYPNPFNPDTYISFALEESGPVSLEIYNIKGQKVITLINHEEQEEKTTITKYWDGCNQKGEQASSGIYFYRLKTKSNTYNRKMVLTK